MKGCECSERRVRGRKKTVESLQRDSQPLAAVTKLRLSSWIQLLIPPLTSILWLWGVGSSSLFLSLCLCLSLFTLFSLSVQTSYLFPLPFPTLLCPLCDPITPLHFLLFPSGMMTCGLEQVREPHLPAWGGSGLPGVMLTHCFVGPSQTRTRLIQFDDARKKWV